MNIIITTSRTAGQLVNLTTPPESILEGILEYTRKSNERFLLRIYYVVTLLLIGIRVMHICTHVQSGTSDEGSYRWYKGNTHMYIVEPLMKGPI